MKVVRQKEEEVFSQISSANKNPAKNYDILDVGAFPMLTSQQKDSTNVEVMKIRINQIYREMKGRNTLIKATLNTYWLKYVGDKDKGSSQPSEDFGINRATFPFRLSVSI